MIVYLLSGSLNSYLGWKIPVAQFFIFHLNVYIDFTAGIQGEDGYHIPLQQTGNSSWKWWNPEYVADTDILKGNTLKQAFSALSNYTEHCARLYTNKVITYIDYNHDNVPVLCFKYQP